MCDKYKKIIVIDDDLCSHLIFKVNIKHLCKPGVPVIQEFTNSSKGVAYLQQVFASHTEPAILFLDINMPDMNGWEVLDDLAGLPDEAKQQLSIFMYSSSLDTKDKQRAALNPLVKGYIEKPLTSGMQWLAKELVVSEPVSA